MSKSGGRRRKTAERRRILLLAALGLVLGQAGVGPAQEKGKFLNPYTGNPEAIAEGRTLWIKNGCSGCHGVGGGGGMGPAVLDDNWKFGSDDETLFKLTRGEISQQTMPSVFGKTLKDEEIWKIIAYIRSVYRGDPARIDWGPPAGKAHETAAVAPAQSPAPEATEPLARGKAAYTTYCVVCHGEGGKGDGPAAAALNPKPRDLTDRAYMGGLDEGYLLALISKGGAGVGKSPLMPPAPLPEQDIRNVIAYLRTLAGSASP